MFEVLSYKSFSADKTTVVGINIIDDLKIFKLIENNYELFQTIKLAVAGYVFTGIFVNYNGTEIYLRENIDRQHFKTRFKYRQMGNRYILVYGKSDV